MEDVSQNSILPLSDQAIPLVAEEFHHDVGGLS
jgi:hypothetical protein